MTRRWAGALAASAVLLGVTSVPVVAATAPGAPAPGAVVAAPGLQPGGYTCDATGEFDLSVAASDFPGFGLWGSGTCTRGSGPTYQLKFSGGGYDLGGWTPCQFQPAPGATPPVQGAPPTVAVTVTLTKGNQTYQLSQTWTAAGAAAAEVMTAYPAYAATISPSGLVGAWLSGAPSGTCYPSADMGRYPLTYKVTFSS